MKIDLKTSNQGRKVANVRKEVGLFVELDAQVAISCSFMEAIRRYCHVKSYLEAKEVLFELADQAKSWDLSYQAHRLGRTIVK